MTLQLLGFTEWTHPSAEADPKVDIGVFEDETTLAVFQSLILEAGHRDRYRARLVTSETATSELDELEVIYFSRADPAEVPRMLRRVENKPIVLIGAFEGFVDMGGMVNFIKRKRRLGFEINLTRSQANGIEYRAKLLRLASRIIEE